MTFLQLQREDHVKKQAEKKPSTNPGETTGETSTVSTVISDFQPPELSENKFLLFIPPSQQHFAMATLAN